MGVIWLLGGVVVGVVATALWARGRLELARAEQARLAQLVDQERRISSERLRLAEEMRARVGETVEAAAARAFTGKHEEFFALADAKLAPVAQKLASLDQHLREFDAAHSDAFGSIRQLLSGLSEANDKLARETGNLTTALRKPQVRGAWGEMQLRNAVEAAGMTAYCDFAEQVSVRSDDGVLRPDLVVRLPGGKQVVVDAKVSLEAYLDAVAATADESTRASKLRDHATQVRRHMVQLGSKRYAEQFSEAPECVVMFLPLEPVLAAALDVIPSLFEEAAANRVILATPSTLLGILFAIARVWRQESVADNAKKISETGQELYRRLTVLGSHFGKLGRGIETVVRAYNETVGSLESRVLVTARKFEELGAVTGTLEEPGRVDSLPRPLTAEELTTHVVPIDSRRAAAEGG